ncbi:MULTISPECIES: helix-turn-helix domain-containing protein [unclassified Streptomyces]|uniref:helix-turn-helix domain-containing protein n=1 Tax=unclassified Streptomyces TaxID=2593676 RepID=UPI0038645FBB
MPFGVRRQPHIRRPTRRRRRPPTGWDAAVPHVQVLAGHAANVAADISLRSLYALFEGRPESVAASIRQRRLERCRADLADPELRKESVQAIAARRGFTSATVFSRTFRAAYGTTPTEYRHEFLDCP